MTIQAPVSTMESTLEAFKAEKLMAVLRCDSAEDALWAGRLLLQNGFKLLDVTYGTPETERVIETLCQEFPEAIIGAGTVLTPAQGLKALGAGAKFLASPVLNTEMVQFGVENNVLILPGVSTPTEMVTAMTAGTQLLKFFPAEPLGGAEFIKAVLGPLPDLPIIATGGIDADDLCDYWDAGVWAVGLGSQLISNKVIQTRDEEKALKRAQKLLAKRDAYLNPDECSEHDHHDKHDKSEKSEHKKHKDHKEKNEKHKHHHEHHEDDDAEKSED